MIKDMLPESLHHNPNWEYFYNVCDYLWGTHVTDNIRQITLPVDALSDNATREDILLRASRIGWTFTDNFTANWGTDERAERFLKRFISSWNDYCRSSAGTDSMAPYMSYLLGMEIRIVQLWSNASNEWDTKPIAKLFPMGTTNLPDDYLVTNATQEVFPGEPDINNFMSITELNNKVPGWKKIDDDPINGWYPTSHFDVYVDLDQVPKSDVQEKSSEDIISGLFYELADICQVLRAIVYSYAFTQVVKIASVSSTVEHIG